MAGLDPAIHVAPPSRRPAYAPNDVDARIKSAHDNLEVLRNRCERTTAKSPQSTGRSGTSPLICPSGPRITTCVKPAARTARSTRLIKTDFAFAPTWK